MTNYIMRGYEPGLYMEIYLPKRTIYQPFLFEVLTNGFEIEHIRNHFRSPKKRPAILNLIGDNPAWRDYTAEYVNNLQPILFGYSMYEVDGVFKGVEESTSIVEERTQIIRLIFRISASDLTRDLGLPEEKTRAVRSLISAYLRSYHRDQLVEDSDGLDRQIYESVKRWRDQLGFFVFGYIIFELCSRIEQLYDEKKIAKVEDEIWVTHFANMELDRVLCPSAQQ